MAVLRALRAPAVWQEEREATGASEAMLSSQAGEERGRAGTVKCLGRKLGRAARGERRGELSGSGSGLSGASIARQPSGMYVMVRRLAAHDAHLWPARAGDGCAGAMRREHLGPARTGAGPTPVRRA